MDGISWTQARSSVAFLWLDRDEDGGVLPFELFGSTGGNGFEVLKGEFDHNEDGVMNQSDGIWHYLRLWIDRNHDGVSQPTELQFLNESAVVEIDLDYKVRDS